MDRFIAVSGGYGISLLYRILTLLPLLPPQSQVMYSALAAAFGIEDGGVKNDGCGIAGLPD